MIDNPFSETRQALYFHLADRWTECDLVVENQEYDPTAGTDHVRLFVLFGEASAQFIGPDRPSRYIGQIVLQIFSAIGTGPAQIDYLTDLAMQVFTKQVINDVHCLDSYPQVVGESSVGGWYQVNVVTPFFFSA